MGWVTHWKVRGAHGGKNATTLMDCCKFPRAHTVLTKKEKRDSPETVACSPRGNLADSGRVGMPLIAPRMRFLWDATD